MQIAITRKEVFYHKALFNMMFALILSMCYEITVRDFRYTIDVVGMFFAPAYLVDWRWKRVEIRSLSVLILAVSA